MNQVEKAKLFASLHQKHQPLILFNVWDAGSARAVAESGAAAIATGSASVAAANGYEDGEAVPLDLVLENIARICRAVELPVTLDFEGGYAPDPEGLRKNIGQVIEAGAIGVNFEDQIVGGDGIYSTEDQRDRIGALRTAADGLGVPLFINARTDLFLKAEPGLHDAAMLEEATARANAYAAAGASGLFAPGLRDLEMVRALCTQSPVPVNILQFPDGPSAGELAGCGVARISHGPFPYKDAMQSLSAAARRALQA